MVTAVYKSLEKCVKERHVYQKLQPLSSRCEDRHHQILVATPAEERREKLSKFTKVINRRPLTLNGEPN